MKKSLSAIVSLAMAFSMFSSVALGATSADFKDLNDLDAATKAKFDAMISAGIFDGVSEDTFGLKDKMNRAQFAKVAALIFGLKVDTSLKTSSFSDVKTEADDPANGYALPYIEALKAAGLTDGYAPGQYNPAGEVTKQELATFLVRGLGWEDQVKSDVGVSDKTVSDWAKGYVALAIEKKILTSGEDGTFGGTSAATRDLLVTAAYEAQQAWKNENKPAKASVAEAKATGAKQVTVTFNRDVDTAKAKLTLKKGTAEVAGTVKFADDKKSATITTDARLAAGSYSVTLSGLDAAEIDKATAEFTAQEETVSKIEFVNANDTVAKTSKAIVKLKATNQYGENTSLPASSFTVYSGDVPNSLKKNDAGELQLTLDTSDDDLDTGVDIIPVTIYENTTRTTVSKNFKLGSKPFVSKLELGSVVYAAGKESLGINESARVDVLQYDQYGNLVAHDDPEIDVEDIQVYLTPYVDEDDLTREAGDSNNDDITDIKFSLGSGVDRSGEFTFNVNSQAGTATGTLKIGSSKVATKVEIADMNNVIAAGDADAYVPIVAYDANGDKLSLEDLTNDTNKERLEFSVSGVEDYEFMTSGEHRGELKLKGIRTSASGVVTVTAMITTANANSVVTKQYTIQKGRTPESIKVIKEPAKKIVGGAESKFEFQIIDQYGKELKNLKYVDDRGNVESGTPNYRVTVVASTYANDGKSIKVQEKDGFIFSSDESNPTVYAGKLDDSFNEEHKFIADADATGVARFTARIEEQNDDGKWVEIDKEVREIEAIKSTDNLTYSVNTVSDLFNAIDSSAVTNYVYGSGELTDKIQEDPAQSLFAKEVVISAKDASGNTVALKDQVTAINASDTSVARTALKGSEGYVLGNKKGTTLVNISFRTHKGEILTRQVTVNVKDDALSVTKVKAGNTAATVAEAQAAKNVYELMELDVVDNYGITYEDSEVQQYAYILGVNVGISNISGGKVTVDQYGKLNIEPSGKLEDVSFDITVTSATGFSATTSVSKNN
ncbi:hypothetical protein J2T17_006233 [Paenibacillus mucilaginosus]|uniref:S-layer homology domain-containing protein n=1 Tax=Paenibacillus mucilaginosus TaxID=61624 RepID=UPI003D21418C